MASVLHDEASCSGRTFRRIGNAPMDRIVGRCLAAELEICQERPEWRWPLERRLSDQATVLPIEQFSPAEVIGGYVRLKFTLRGSNGTNVLAGAVLPVIAYCEASRTYTLLLDESRPGWAGTQISNVPRNCLDIVPGLTWPSGAN